MDHGKALTSCAALTNINTYQQYLQVNMILEISKNSGKSLSFSAFIRWRPYINQMEQLEWPRQLAPTKRDWER